MSIGSFRGTILPAFATIASLLLQQPASAEPCANSCARGRNVCVMQARTTFVACLQGCGAGDLQCSAACRTASRAARTTCQATHNDCKTTCPPSSTTDTCTVGCSASAKASFTNGLAAGRTCVQNCKATGGSGLGGCLKQCAATLGSSGATSLAAFQGCLTGCQGQVTGVCFSTTAMQCTADPCGPEQPCSQPNEFCSERCAVPPPSGTCYDASTLQCTDQTCSATQPCPQANQTCLPACPPPPPQGKCFDTTSKQCTDQACDSAHRCTLPPQICTLQCPPPPQHGTCFDTSTMQCTDQACSDEHTCAANQRCVLQCPPPTPVAQCSSVPCDGTCVISPACPPGEACPELRQHGRCASDANGNCACVPVSPEPTRTARPTPTPQCQDLPCGGPCTIGPSCQLGKPCPEFPTRLGACAPGAAGNCECVPVSPQPTPTRKPPQCSAAPCGGSCALCPDCQPGMDCPEKIPCRQGTCQADASGVCQCVPAQLPTPTARPTCASDADCNDANVCTADHCAGGRCEHACVCVTANGASRCCKGPGELCVRLCGADGAGTCGGVCPPGADCQAQPTAPAGCGCVSDAGGPCGGNLFAPPPVCASGLVCQQQLPDATGVCVAANCVPLFTSGCSQTSDCCEPCGDGTRAPCGVCVNGTCVGAP